MDHYLDIALRPDPEVTQHQLMSALYLRLHRALASLGSSNIGVSFPELDAAGHGLGARMRLHGQSHALAELRSADWLAGVRDHVDVGGVLKVPVGAKQRGVRRVQAQSSPARLRRRLMRRHNLDAVEAARRIPDSAARLLRLPFVEITSGSTHQRFRLFIAHGPLCEHPIAGTFSSYGFSQQGTVPWF